MRFVHESQLFFYPYQNRVCLFAGRSVKRIVLVEKVDLVTKRAPRMVIPVESIHEEFCVPEEVRVSV